MTLTKDSYTIRQVIELTGVTEFLLRIWELRYNAIAPERSKSGRRLYSAEDVIKIASLATLTNRGYRIGKIASLDTPELQKLIQQSFLEAPTTIEKNKTPENKDIKALFDMLSKLDWLKFKSRFFEITQGHNAEEVIFKILLPIIGYMNQLVDSGKLSITQEHFVTALLKDHLYKLKNDNFSIKAKSKDRFIFATPEGDLHDLGLLIAATLTSMQKIENLYLGAHLPKKDLAETCLRFKATHLLLATTVTEDEGAKENILSYLNFLDRHLPKKMKIWIAGRNTKNLILKSSRQIEIINSFDQFNTNLKR